MRKIFLQLVFGIIIAELILLLIPKENKKVFAQGFCGWDPPDYAETNNCTPPYVPYRVGDPRGTGFSCDCVLPQSPIPTATPFPQSNCPICLKDYMWNEPYKACQNIKNPSEYKNPQRWVNCGSESCQAGYGCGGKDYRVGASSSQPSPCSVMGTTGIETALGCIPTGNVNQFIAWFLKFAIGIGGGIAFLLMLIGVFQIITSAGDPERLKAGKELITSALIGLLMIIFSVFLLQLIGVQILQIPGFAK